MAPGPDPGALASAALRRGEWPAALQAAQAWLNAEPGAVDGHFAAGVALLEMRRVQAAAEHLRKASELAPTRADCAAQSARALSLLQRSAEALAAAEQALALKPRDAYTLDTLGVVLSRANAHRQAVALFRHAIDVVPGRASYRFNLAASLTFCGEVAAAEREYDACLALDPHYWRAYSARSQLRRHGPHDNHLQQLQSLLPSLQGQPEALLHVHLALAKELEDMQEHAQAFTHFRAGKAAWRTRLNYHSDTDKALFHALMERFPAPPVPELDGHPSGEPIFIVGMPRSGTTLVERILSSHPLVQSAGELQNFGLALKRVSGSRSRHLLDADTIARSRSLDWRALGEAYVSSTRPVTGQQPHFIDKLPHNFLYLGYIARALPKARILCLRRDLRDTCISNFRQMFALNTPYFDYAYDLEDTARYCRLFAELMAHWQRVLPGRVLEISYEDLVSDQAAVTRRLLAHCGLEWDAACLDFEHNPAPVATASAVQVRSPIYSSSVGRWKRYESALDEVKAILAGW